MEGLFLQTVEALGESQVVDESGEMWQLLQGEKENVERENLTSGPLCHEATFATEFEACDDAAQELPWRHRKLLEDRLRNLNDAQDRLIDGGFGCCVECGGPIAIKRLLADPAALTCLDCQQRMEGELLCRTL